MGLCIPRRLSTKNKGGKGQGERGAHCISLTPSPLPFPLLDPSHGVLVFLDVVSVNPRTRLRAVASFKQDILIVLASQKVYAGIDILV